MAIASHSLVKVTYTSSIGNYVSLYLFDLVNIQDTLVDINP